VKLPRNTALHVALALSAERVVPVGRLALLGAAARFDDIAGAAGVSKRTAANARRAIARSIARIAPLAR
jgi:hypothetical protein